MPDHLIAFFGHHKCGTTWITEMLLDVAREARLNVGYVHNDESCGGDLGRYVSDNRIDLLLYVNADIDQVRRLGRFRGFHVIRDPRDLVVSAYFSHRFTHELQPWLEEHREALLELDETDGLIAEMSFPVTRMVLDQIGRWDYGSSDCLEFDLNELSSDVEAAFIEIVRFTGLPIGSDKLRRVVYEHRFEAKASGRSAGDVDNLSHYRSGRAGDWKNHLKTVHLEEFRSAFGDLAKLLGYSG